MATDVMNGLPPLPEGASLDAQSPELPPLPDGAQLDAQPEEPQLPPLPEGAQLDSQEPMPGVLEALKQGTQQAFREQVQSGEALAGAPGEARDTSPAAQPIDFSSGPGLSVLPKIAYSFGHSAPVIGSGVAGATLGGEVAGPAGAFVGGTTAAGAASAIQTLGPAFKAELDKTPDDPDGAYQRALKSTANSGAWGALGWAVGGAFNILETPVKNFLFQTFVAQPAVMAGQKATQNVIEGQPVLEGTGQAAAEGAVMGVPIVAGHALANKALTGRFFPEPPQPPGMTPGREDQIPPAGGGGGAMPPLPEGATLDQGPSGPKPLEGEILPPLPPAQIEGPFQMGQPQIEGPSPLEVTQLARSGGFFSRFRKQEEEAPPEPRQRTVQTELDSVLSPHGLTADESRDTIYIKNKDGETVGRFYWRDTREGPQFGNIHLDDEYQRKGIGTAVQHYLETKTGKWMIPDTTLSQAEYNRWLKIDRTAVEGRYQKQGDMYFQNPLATLADLLKKNGGSFSALRLNAAARGRQELESFGPMKISALEDVSEQTLLDRQLQKVRDSVQQQQIDAANARNRYDVNEPRYVLDEGADYHLYNATDLEQAIALRGNQPRPPVIHQVDMRSLQADKVTASSLDLPPGNSPRVKLGDVSPEAYEMMRAMAPGERHQAYMQLIDQGLRVTPSAGASLMYSGAAHATPVKEIPRTGRTQYVYMQDSQGREMLHSFEQSVIGNGPEPTSVDFKTVDRNRINPDNFISADPEDIIQLPAYLFTPEQRRAWYEAARNKDGEALLKLADEGVFVDANFDGSRPTQSALATKKIPREAVVPAYAPVGSLATMQHGADFAKPVGRPKGSVRIDTGTPFERFAQFGSTDRGAQAQMMKEVLEQDIKPVLDATLARFGAKNQLEHVILQTSNELSPGIKIEPGVVEWPALWYDLMKSTGVVPYGTPRQAMQQIAFHEVGHLVTMRSWERTPVDIQNAVFNAYDRARLRFNITADPGSTNSVFEGLQGQSEVYYLSFVEWQAEQFRRWMNSNDKALTDVDKYFKNGLQDIIEVRKAVNDKMGWNYENQMFQSDHAFNSWMDYIEANAHGSFESPLQFTRAAESVSLEPPELGDLEQAHAFFMQERENLKNLFAEGINVTAVPEAAIDFREGMVDYGSYNRATRTIRLMLGSLAWISKPGAMLDTVRGVLVHEAYHGIEDTLPASVQKLLHDTARREKVLKPREASSYRKYFYDQFIKKGFAPVDAKRLAEDFVAREWRAKLVERGWFGWRFDERTNSVLDKLSRTFERLGNALQGYGFRTAEDVLHAFYRGEVTARANKVAREQARAAEKFPPAKVSQGFLSKLKEYTTSRGDRVFLERRNNNDNDVYEYYTSDGKLAGRLELDGKGEVQMIETMALQGRDLPATMIRIAEEARGEPLRTAQLLTQAGYKMVNRLYADNRTKYYVFQPLDKLWYSPKAIWEGVKRNEQRLRELRARKDPQDAYFINHTERQLEKYKNMAEQIPNTAQEDPILLKQWSSRSFTMDEWYKDWNRRSAGAYAKVTGDTSLGTGEDPYSAANRRAEAEAAASNPIEAVPQPELKSMQGIFRRYGQGTRQVRNPQGRRQVNTDQDRTWTLVRMWGNKIVSLGKSALTIKQLGWLNPHIPSLRDYISFRDQQEQRVNQWISRADGTARAWDGLVDGQRNALSDMMFWATEMRYRSRQEVQNRVVRHPSQAEIQRYAQRNRIGPEAMQLYQQVTSDFDAFLADMERVFTDQINRRFSQPAQAQTRATELAELARDMQRMRSRPYFPMTRFGKFSLTARDPHSGQVGYFSLFETIGQRDAAFQRLSAQNPLHNWSVSMVPEGVYDFMGLPQPLLQRIKNQLPGITPQQADWIDRFSQLMSPQNSFKKRWLERRGTPGYSLDGVRAYAQYFRSGARYLSRIEFIDQIQQAQRDLERSAIEAGDGTSRQIISDTVNSHAKWMDSPGKDWIKLKAAATLYQLGFSPAAAMMNVTQVPQVTYPYLSNLFGEKALLNLGMNVMRSGFRTAWTRAAARDPVLANAHAEMVRQGRIDLGQAAELGSFADHDRLDRSWAGTQAQRRLRQLQYAAMFMFQQTERFNREWTFETAYKLALADPNNAHVRDLTITKTREHADVMARTGMTPEQASAFLVAKEAIDRTQFTYSSWDRPAFLRSKLGGASRIFFSYTQQMLFSFAANPGRLKMLAITGALYGAMGLPGADDIDSIVHLIARKVFGKDFNLEKATRELVRDLTKGTFLDEVGPDLVLHGISRFGFGAALLPEFMGWPKFDASANGSMGKIVPGLSTLMNGIATSGADPDHWKDVSAKFMQDLAGPGLGVFFPWMQYMNSSPYSGDQKKWESLLPRSFKAMAKAYHMYNEGGIRDKNGNLRVPLDPNDPDDRATMIAQALGFSPLAQTKDYERYEMQNNTDTFYKARAMELRTDMFKGVKNRDQQVIQDVTQGIQAYNKDVIAAKRPDLVISAQGLIRGLRTKMKAHEAAEQGVPANKTELFGGQQYQDLFPGPSGSSVIDRRRVQ